MEEEKGSKSTDQTWTGFTGPKGGKGEEKGTIVKVGWC